MSCLQEVATTDEEPLRRIGLSNRGTHGRFLTELLLQSYTHYPLVYPHATG